MVSASLHFIHRLSRNILYATVDGPLIMLHIYIKPWCPWCVVALETLDALGCDYTPHDVETEPGAAEKVRQLSNQTRVPTMQAGEHVLADFGPEEIAPFLSKHGILPPQRPTAS